MPTIFSVEEAVYQEVDHDGKGQEVDGQVNELPGRWVPVVLKGMANMVDEHGCDGDELQLKGVDFFISHLLLWLL